MAARAQEHLRREAVERACRCVPGLAPESVEVVELTRGEAYAVVRSRDGAVVVLDGRGGAVRDAGRLGAVGAHLLAVQQVRRARAEAELPRRLAHTRESLALLETLERSLPRGPAGFCEEAMRALRALEVALTDLLADEQRSAAALPTVRTLRASVALLHRAASADRAVVRAVRALGVSLAASPPFPARGKVLRWALTRLASPDLPCFMEELAAAEQQVYGARFAEAAARLPV